MWELDHREGWELKNWCFWTVLLEMTLECPLDCKEIKPINPKGEQPWIFIGRTAAETEAPVLCGHLMRWLGSITNSMKFEQTPGDSWGPNSLACCSPWVHRGRHDLATEQQQPTGGWGSVSRLTSCLAWGVPVLVLTGWWAEQCPSANKLEGGFQDGTW